MAKKGSAGSWIVVALVVLALSQCFKSPASNAPETPASRQPDIATRAPQSSAPIPSAPPTVTAPPASAIDPAMAPVRYVTASTLNLRVGPTTDAEVVGKLPNGLAIRVLRQEGDWLFVDAGARQGWVSGAYTAASLPAPVMAPAPSLQPAVAGLPSFDRNDVVQQIIDRSIRNYSGNCPCPYNRMSNGRRCGGNSAYSKPGGRSPICFPEQVTDAMIATFLGR